CSTPRPWMRTILCERGDATFFSSKFVNLAGKAGFSRFLIINYTAMHGSNRDAFLSDCPFAIVAAGTPSYMRLQ
ncbi:hypothetical protein, partial [Pantoea sp. A4]|uniref:hypothetical protein n=1 Tax=Pantoea sp. A4 TaxID=1225184 RepID=UPI000560C07F